jgi:cell division septation protein DedD
VSAIPADAPTFEVVRADPGAPPVLAGRAAPGSQLLVLDTGDPIGAAAADANGEWARVGETPLSPGGHELSLALKTPQGSLVVEQADADMAPSAGASAGLPIPAEKPTPGVVERSYVVQLASVPSRADATREWARLQQAYPGLLGQRDVTIDAAEIGERGTFYRIRTGPFGGRDDARSLCRELNGAGQECLVVRGAGGN